MKSLLLIEVFLFAGIGGILGLFSGETTGILYGAIFGLGYYLIYLFFKSIFRSGQGGALGFYGCAGIIMGAVICGVGDLVRLLAYQFYTGEEPVYFALMKPRGKWTVTAPALSLTGPTLKLSNRPVSKIEFMADSNLMIATTIGENNQETYSIWDMNDRNQIIKIEAHAVFSEEGKIAYCSPGKGVQVMDWRKNSLEVLHEFENISANYKSIQFLNQTKILSAITDTGTITLWDVTSGIELYRITGGDGKYTRTALSSDGTRLAAGTEEGIIRVWDIVSGNMLQQLGKKGFGSKGQVHDLAFTADGAKIITSQAYAMVCWEINTGKIIYSQTPTMSLDHFLPNAMGSELILGTSSNPAQRQLLVRDIQTGKPNPQFKKLNGEFVWSYELSPDKKIVFMAQGGEVTLYDLPQATVMRTQRVNQLNTWVPALAISPDGRTFATGSEVGLTRVWRTDDGICLQETSTSDAMVTALAFSNPDRGLLAAGDVNGRVSFWDIKQNL